MPVTVITNAYDDVLPSASQTKLRTAACPIVQQPVHNPAPACLPRSRAQLVHKVIPRRGGQLPVRGREAQDARERLPRQLMASYSTLKQPVLRRLLEPKQYVSIRYSERLAEAVSRLPAVGSGQMSRAAARSMP